MRYKNPSIAKLVQQLTFNQGIAGSSPAGRANYLHRGGDHGTAIQGRRFRYDGGG